jgi:hypothetical protein
MHGAHRFQVLINDRIDGAAARLDIAFETADQPDIVGGIHEDTDVEQFAKFWLYEEQDAFNKDDGCGLTRVVSGRRRSEVKS